MPSSAVRSSHPLPAPPRSHIPNGMQGNMAFAYCWLWAAPSQHSRAGRAERSDISHGILVLDLIQPVSIAEKFSLEIRSVTRPRSPIVWRIRSTGPADRVWPPRADWRCHLVASYAHTRLPAGVRLIPPHPLLRMAPLWPSCTLLGQVR